jgi:GMP synthase-like glutamine amidotransferase
VRLAVLRHEDSTGLGRLGDQFERHGVDHDVIWTTRGRLPEPYEFDGAVVLGGSISANDAALAPARAWVREAVLNGVPYLGVCLGGQLLASALGARVRSGSAEVGIHDIFLTDAAGRDPLFSGLPRRLEVFGFHGESFALPRGAVPLAGSLACTFQAFRYAGRAYGLQFHPEVRAADLTRWREASGYRDLVARSGRSLADLHGELDAAAAELDRLTAHLCERWLTLVVRRTTLRRLPLPA